MYCVAEISTNFANQLVPNCLILSYHFVPLEVIVSLPIKLMSEDWEVHASAGFVEFHRLFSV